MPDPLKAARRVAEIINRSSSPRAYLAVCRRDGRPTEADRGMWRQLRRLVSGDRLDDMVAFNRRQAWSMRAEDATEKCVGG